MQPMKPADVHRILSQRPDVTLDHIHEYQQLLSDWQKRGPDRNAALANSDTQKARVTRLNELHEKLFGDRPKLTN